MQANNSLSSQLSNINMSQENILKISKAYLEAITSQKANISVELTNLDNSKSTIVLPSNTFLSNEFRRLDATLKNIIGLSADGKARIIASDGAFRELMVSTFMSSLRPEISDMSVSTSINVSTNSVLENLLSPLTEVEIALDSKFNSVSSVFITKIVTDDLSGTANGMTFGEAKLLFASRNQTFKIFEFDKPFVAKKTRYYGQFEVTNLQFNQGILSIKIDKTRYSDSNNLYENTKLLEVGDKLTNSDGSALLEILSCNEDALLITAKIISGVGVVKNGSKLQFKENVNSSIAVRVPVRLREKSIIFLSVIDKNTNISSAMSTGNVFDSSNFVVNNDGITSTFDEFFSSRVADIGRYLESVVRENSIPAVLGEKPLPPTLTSSDFNVVQINKHLTNTPGTEKMMKIQKEKSTTESKSNILTASISDLNQKLSQGNYNSSAKRDADQNLLNKLIDDKQKLAVLLGTLVTDLNVALNDNAESSISPKYRVRGFWPVQKPIASDVTNPQHIVQYEIRFRYVSANSTTATSESMVFTDGENSVNAQFSGWQFTKTAPLRRTVDSNGIASWVSNQPSDTEYASINQLDIPISFGESVEFNIRAISEAGYPMAPITSEWSILTRVNFPEELLQESDIAALQRKNSEDQIRVRIAEEFANQGITKHISKSFQEQEKYFPHNLDDIASGKTTPEQKQISALKYIETLESKLLSLQEKVDRRYSTATIQIVDGNMKTHDVNNNSTIELFAGNYSDLVDLSNSDNFGSIAEKTFYLKLLNRNQQTIEMLSISPGVLSQAAPNSKYSTAPIYNSGSNIVTEQKKGQIFYLRNVNVDGDEQLYIDDTTTIETVVQQSDIDASANESLKNIVNFNGSTSQLVKLTANADLSTYATITRNHPSYVNFISSNDSTPLVEIFDRLQHFNGLFKSKDVQTSLNDNMIVRYEKNDKFLVGKNTCGSTMFASVNSVNSFQVQGIDTSASKEMYTGDEDALLIPIKFQFRMTDAIGNPDGNTQISTSSNFEYRKKIGFDLLVSGKIFSFDLVVFARFRATSVTNNVINQSYATITTTSQPNIQ